ncbi:zyg eleven-related protein 1 [Ditylenchus destructor]|nr:zyg eleven-related protein 1 [Ditylenchus destructor]
MLAKDKPLRAPSLLELSANVVSARNPVVELPMTASEIVVKHVCKNLRNESASADSVAESLRPFLDGERQPLGRLDLSGLNISHRTLALLLAAQQSTLTSLDLSHIGLTSLDISSEEVCSILTDLKVKSLKLKSLKVTSCDLLRIPRFRIREMQSRDSYAMHMSNVPPAFGQDDYNLGNLELIGSLPHFVEFCPNIQHLYLLQGLLNNIKEETADEFLCRIFKALKKLRTLDLSEWHFPNDLHILEKKLVPNLTTLILYDVKNLESCIPGISNLKHLRCLDLSQSAHTNGQYSKPVTCLHTLVTELPNLECLDISGTNLTSAVSDDDRPHTGIDFVPSYIAGLSFLSQPLKYLGIFNCNFKPHFENIPAELICCDYGEDQIILALEAYMSRPSMLKIVLVKSYHMYRFETGLNRHVDALHLMLQVLSSHRTNRSLQVAGHFAMFFILRQVDMNRDTKQTENHMDEREMVETCCCSLYQFKIPRDFQPNYIRIAKLMVRVLMSHGSNFFTQKIVLKILNSMALDLDANCKIQLSPIEILETIVAIIRRKHAAGTCDIVMQLCWEVLCNMTDENPPYCERFLKEGGMQLFSLCVSQFPNNDRLLVYMIFLVGNVAEVKYLRSQLMDNNYLTIFWNLLFMNPNFTNCFEISYSSAYVLAHLFSEGEAAWQSAMRMRRRDVMEHVIATIGMWDLSTFM